MISARGLRREGLIVKANTKMHFRAAWHWAHEGAERQFAVYATAAAIALAIILAAIKLRDLPG